MKSPEERLNDYIENYKKDWYNTLNDMKNTYDDESEYWWIIEELLDRIKDLESKGE